MMISLLLLVLGSLEKRSFYDSSSLAQVIFF
jgi:hypothetical protein